MRMLSLFSGIGGFDIAAEWLGWEIVGQCEIDAFCIKVLEKHWPTVKRYGDIRYLVEHCEHLRGGVDIITGGFPCQDVSDAGKRIGINGSRSGLWHPMHQIVSVVRPKFVVVENVPGLLRRGMGRVLGDLSSIGYDTEWTTISACAVGAPHPRERVYVVAYPAGEQCFVLRKSNNESDDRNAEDHGNVPSVRCQDRECFAMGSQDCSGRMWAHEPANCRVADGVPDRMDRIRSLGNAVVPQVAYIILKAIQEANGN